MALLQSVKIVGFQLERHVNVTLHPSFKRSAE